MKEIYIHINFKTFKNNKDCSVMDGSDEDNHLVQSNIANHVLVWWINR
jgi:hypothetical protein